LRRLIAQERGAKAARPFFCREVVGMAKIRGKIGVERSAQSRDIGGRIRSEVGNDRGKFWRAEDVI
jgi:hypothetical protein